MKKLFLLLALIVSVNSYSKCYTTYAQTIWDKETNTWKEWVDNFTPFCIDDNSNDITMYLQNTILKFYCYKIEETEKSEMYPFSLVFYCVAEDGSGAIIQLRQYNINNETGWQLLFYDSDNVIMYAIQIN